MSQIGTRASASGGLRGADALAALSVALVLIPQSLAYAELAGIPAYHGLYAAAVAPIAAAFFASSPYLQTGPTAMASVLTFGALAAVGAPFTATYVGLTAMLAVLVGVMRLLLGVLRAGTIAYFMSQPVLRGFTSGAAILIIATQIPRAVGVEPGPDGYLTSAWSALISPGGWNVWSALLAVFTVVAVRGGRRLHPLFPGVLVAVLAGGALGAWLSDPGPVLGSVSLGHVGIEGVDLAAAPRLLVPAAVIALVGFAEPAAIARVYAARDRQVWSPDRELVSQGMANVAAGIAGGLPVGGSFSRTSLNRLAGGRTRWTGALTGILVLVFLPAAGVLATLPRAVLAAIVIGAVVPLVRLRPLLRMVRHSKPQGLVGGFTFAATLALAPRIDYAVLLGIGLSVAVHLWREVQIHVAARVHGRTLILQPSGVLYFASAPALEAALNQELAAHPDIERLVLDLSGLGRIDYSGAVVIQDTVVEAQEAGLTVEFLNVPPHAHTLLRVTGVSFEPGLVTVDDGAGQGE